MTEAELRALHAREINERLEALKESLEDEIRDDVRRCWDEYLNASAADRAAYGTENEVGARSELEKKSEDHERARGRSLGAREAFKLAKAAIAESLAEAVAR
jgi:hypothetical protein